MKRVAFAIGRFQPGTFLLGCVHGKKFVSKVSPARKGADYRQCLHFIHKSSAVEAAVSAAMNGTRKRIIILRATRPPLHLYALEYARESASLSDGFTFIFIFAVISMSK